MANGATPIEVTGAGGVRLAAYSSGDPTARPVLLVHGYPDTHAVWDVVAARLSAHHHVLRYDARGAGASGAPAHRADYRVENLATDARLVAAALHPQAPVHVVGHDWGSVTGWVAATSPEAGRWMASYTSVSGPHPTHTVDWIGGTLRHPSAARLSRLGRQGLHSWYLGVFQLPWLPELAWRRVLGPRWRDRLRRTEGVVPGVGHPAGTLVADAVHGLELYRANVLSTRRLPGRARVPVQLVVPLRDRYVTPAWADAALAHAEPVWRRTLDTGHWGALITHGVTLADWIAHFAQHVDGGPADRELRAARVVQPAVAQPSTPTK